MNIRRNGADGTVPMGNVVDEVLRDLVAKGYLTPEAADAYLAQAQTGGSIGDVPKARRALPATPATRSTMAEIDRRMGMAPSGPAVSRDQRTGRITISSVRGPVRVQRHDGGAIPFSRDPVTGRLEIGRGTP